MNSTLKFCAALVISILLSEIAFGQQYLHEDIIRQVFGEEGEICFTFQADSREQVNSLSSVISIDQVTPDLVVRAYANKNEFDRFISMGLNYKKLPHPGDFNGFLNMKQNIEVREIEEWDFYPTYEGYVDMMNQFAAEYPALCRVSVIGTTNQGRELIVANISDNVGINENEPEFLYTSSIHGDELTGYVLMLRLIDYLLSNYGTDPEVTEIVNNVDLYINPLANPDGTYAGGNNTVNGSRRGNAFFVDLNRNYPDPADGPHPDGNAWQTETIVFMEYAEEMDFVASCNFHGGAEVCNYPWDTWAYYCADDAWWQYVCREYADTVHVYAPAGYLTDLDNGITNGYAWYRITGGRQDYMNFFHQCREFTLEISETKLVPPNQLPSFWNYNYRSLLNYIEQCQYGIRGTVKDASTGWPVEAEAYALLHEADSSWVYSSLPNGNYHRLLSEGTYTLRYSAPGYEPAVKNGLVVTNRQATVVDVLLTPSTGVGGLGNNPVSQGVDIYPNPSNDGILNVSSRFLIYEVVLRDISGKEIRRSNVDQKQVQLDLQDIPNGFYTIELITEKGRGVKKVVVEK